MSQRHRASLGGFSYAQNKNANDRDNAARSFSASRQTIIGYKPNNPNRSSSAGRESILGSRPEAKSLAPGATFGKGQPKKKTETKVYLEKKDLSVLINNIFEFLSTHGYESAISKKGLSNGNKNIFLSMLSFLIRLLDPCFNVDLNLVTEDDVLRLLKLVGYSYSFSKNFFAAIGAPNNWTHCLHILNWMVELIKYFEETHQKDKAPKEIVDKSDNELLNDFVQKKFQQQNTDSMEIEGSSELSDKLTRRYDYLQVLLKDYELKIENIKLVLQNTLHDFPDPNELSIKICQLKDEVFNIEQLIARARNENTDLTSSNQDLKREIHNLEHDIQVLSKDKQDVSTLIQNQPFNVEESERFMKEINKSETNKSKLLQSKNEKVNKKYRLIQGLEDIISELEMRAQAFNNTIQSERDIFTKCSGFLINFDHSIVTDVRVDDPCYTSDENYLKKLCGIDPKKEVKPTLREIIEGNSKNIKQMEDQITTEKFSYQQLEDEIQELNAKIEEHNFKLKRVLEAYEDKVEILNRENSTFSETRQKLQKEIDELREKLGDAERMKMNVTTALNNIMHNLDKCSNEYSENQRQLKELLNSDFNLALAHKKEIINNLREIDNKFGKIKESFEEYLE